MPDDVSRETPPAPDTARGVFGDRLPLAERYTGWLATAGTVRGLIGPREVPRLWERHVLNSAVLAEVVPEGADVADIGSGAGLPGIPLAIARPDLRITLIEPLLRRVTFLEEVVTDLGLDGVRVVRGRAEELAGDLEFDVVTSRAVAPLTRLGQWSLPLVRVGGQFLPMKGTSAAEELAESAGALQQLGAGTAKVLTLGGDVVVEPVTVIRVPKTTRPPARVSSARSPRRKGGASR